MKALVVYGSVYGNTRRIAEIVAGAVKGKAISAMDFRSGMLTGTCLLIVGSPVHGGRPSEAVQAFLNALPEQALRGMKIAAFDTRMEESVQKLPLRLLMRTIGYAAPRIADTLVRKGGTEAAAPTGFFVTGKEGPLKKGELERAGKWGIGISGMSAEA